MCDGRSPEMPGDTYDLSGRRVSKNDARVHFQGDADELNAHLGMVRATHPREEVRRFIEKIQTNVSMLMAHVSDISNDSHILPEDEAIKLKRETDRLSGNIPAGFVLPGKSVLEARIHIARTIARRAERSAVAVSENHPVSPSTVSYLNALSGYLFALGFDVLQ